MTPTDKHVEIAYHEITRWLAEYKGQTVEITSNYHYSPDRCWVIDANGGKFNGYSGGSVYKLELKNVRKVVGV